MLGCGDGGLCRGINAINFVILENVYASAAGVRATQASAQTAATPHAAANAATGCASSGGRHSAYRTGKAQIGRKCGIFLEGHPSARASAVISQTQTRPTASHAAAHSASKTTADAASSLAVGQSNRNPAVRRTQIHMIHPPATGNLRFENLHLVGLEHQARPIAKFTQLSLAGVLLDF